MPTAVFTASLVEVAVLLGELQADGALSSSTYRLWNCWAGAVPGEKLPKVSFENTTAPKAAAVVASKSITAWALTPSNAMTVKIAAETAFVVFR